MDKKILETLISVCRKTESGVLCESCSKGDKKIKRCYSVGWEKCKGKKYIPKFIKE